MANDTTQSATSVLLGTIVRKLLTVGGTALAAHGILATGSQVETFVSVGLAVAGVAWSFWNDYGRVIVLSKLQVWKAKAEAQADALHKANVPAPTNAQIADKIPDPKVTAEVVAKTVAACLMVLLVLTASPAFAQREDSTPRARQGIKLPIDPLGLNQKMTGDPAEDIINALDAKLLPDLKYALNLATKSNNGVTAPCYAAWIAIIEARQNANVDDQGNPMTPPDPGLITKFEKLVELRNALQPESDFMIKCSPVASMVKSDIRKFIGLILTGGAGLAALGIGL